MSGFLKGYRTLLVQLVAVLVALSGFTNLFDERIALGVSIALAVFTALLRLNTDSAVPFLVKSAPRRGPRKPKPEAIELPGPTD